MPRRPAHGQEEEATDEVAQAETGIRGEDSREEPDHSETREAGKSDKRDNKKRSKDKKGEIRKDKRKKDKKDKKDKKEKAKRHELKAFGRAKDRKRKQTAEEKEREWNSFLSFELNEAPSQPSSNLPNAGITFEVSQHETRPAPADPISSDPVHDPVMELRRRIEQLLVSSGGESTVGRAEAKLRTTLNSKVLSSFSITPASDRSTSNAIIRLTAKQACALLEEPSLQLAALEESYFALGEEVLQSGLDFSNEDRFRDLFDDFLAKREDLRMASQRMEPKKPYIPRTRRAKRSHRDLPPMTEDEKNLLHDVRRVMKALSHDTWIPLSQLLEDAKIRRARWKLPLGLSLWQWLSLRCDEQLTTVNQGSDMLLQLSEGAVPQKGLRMSNEERRQQLSEAVFETLAVLQRDFPQGGGLDVDDLRQVPAVSRLQFERAALIQALKKQRTLEVSSRGGRLMVRLRDAPQQGEPKERNGPVKTIDRLETEKVDGTVPEPGASKSLIPDRPLPVNVADWQREQEYWFKGMKPLPEGWIRCLSRNSKQMYYYDTKNCKSASQEPQEPAQPRTPMAMPG